MSLLTCSIKRAIELHELEAQGYAKTSPEVIALATEISNLGKDLEAHIEAQGNLQKAYDDTQSTMRDTEAALLLSRYIIKIEKQNAQNSLF